MKVLSLFDGMSCGQIAFKELCIDVEKYYAYEIDKYAIQVTQHNFPATEQCGDVFKADFTKYNNIDWLIGGSPCTYWSIAQKNNRETEASGLGWELFSQYVRALHEAKPKYFLYENNKSMSKEIRASIDKTFGFEAIGINSALVSAQNRQRLYWVGIRQEDGTYKKADIEQPKDRGILLKDILINRMIATGTGNGNGIYYAEKTKPDCLNSKDVNGKQPSLEDRIYSVNGKATACTTGYITNVAEPIRVGALPRPNGELSTSQGMRVYSVDGKSVTQSAQGGGLGAKTGLYAIPNKNPEQYLSENMIKYAYKQGTKNFVCKEKVMPDKSCPLTKEHNKRAGTTNYIPTNVNDIDCTITTNKDIPNAKPIYEVKDGFITIKDKQYPIKLKDDYYIIRKLYVKECARLQTVPNWYDFSCISNSQAYKCLGNGWTVEVIKHLIYSALTNNPKQEQKQLSIFDL